MVVEFGVVAITMSSNVSKYTSLAEVISMVVQQTLLPSSAMRKTPVLDPCVTATPCVALMVCLWMRTVVVPVPGSIEWWTFVGGLLPST